MGHEDISILLPYSFLGQKAVFLSENTILPTCIDVPVTVYTEFPCGVPHNGSLASL